MTDKSIQLSDHHTTKVRLYKPIVILPNILYYMDAWIGHGCLTKTNVKVLSQLQLTGVHSIFWSLVTRLKYKKVHLDAFYYQISDKDKKV